MVIFHQGGYISLGWLYLTRVVISHQGGYIYVFQIRCRCLDRYYCSGSRATLKNAVSKSTTFQPLGVMV